MKYLLEGPLVGNEERSEEEGMDREINQWRYSSQYRHAGISGMWGD